MHHLFISYSRKDREFVERLEKALVEQGHAVWVDWKDIPLTAEFMVEIRRAIDEADSFLFVLSPDSVASPVCRQELEHASLQHKRLIPILCRALRTEEVPPALAPLNWVAFDGFADLEPTFRSLQKAIETDLEWVHAHTELLRNASEWQNGGHNRSLLLRGEKLAASEHWLVRSTDGRQPQPTPLQHQYVLMSRRDASRRLRTVISAVSFALIVTTALAILTFILFRLAETRKIEAQEQARLAEERRKDADTQRQLAEQRALVAESRRLAADAEAQVGTRLDLAMLLSVAAFRTQPTAESRIALLSALQQNPYVKRFLSGHTGPVLSVAYHPNGSFLVSGGENEMIVWDLPKVRPARAPLPQRDARMLRFSPDSRVLGVRTRTGSAFWDTHTWKPIGGPVTGAFAGFSVDGKAILLTPELHLLDVWTGEQDKPSLSLRPADYPFSSLLALSPDRNWLTANDQGLVLWNLTSGDRLQAPPAIPVRSGFGGALLFDPKGRFVLSSEYSGTIRFLDPKTLAPAGQAIEDLHGDIQALAVSPDGEVMASGGAGRHIRLWSMSSRKQIGGDLAAHRGEVHDLAFSPDGKTLASAGDDGTVILWDVIAPQPPGKMLGGYRILSRVDHFGTAVALTSMEEDPLELMLRSANFLRFSRDATALAMSSGGSVEVWNVRQGKRQMGPRPLFLLMVGSLALSPDGKILAASGADANSDPDVSDARRVELIEVPSGKRLIRPLLGEQFFGRELTFSPDGRTLIVGGGDNELYFLDMGSHELLGKPRPPGLGDISALAYHPAGRELVVSAKLADASETTTDLWDMVARKRVRALFRTGQEISLLAFSPDGRWLASGAKDGSVTVRDGTTFEPQALPFQASAEELWALSFSADGELLAVAGPGGVQLWDTREHREIGSPLVSPKVDIVDETTSEIVGAVAFAPDGKTLLTAYPFSKTLVHWDLDPESWVRRICRIVHRNLTPVEWKQYMGTAPYQETCPHPHASGAGAK